MVIDQLMVSHLLSNQTSGILWYPLVLACDRTLLFLQSGDSPEPQLVERLASVCGRASYKVVLLSLALQPSPQKVAGALGYVKKVMCFVYTCSKEWIIQWVVDELCPERMIQVGYYWRTQRNRRPQIGSLESMMFGNNGS